ncbi:hypothetical protein NYD60_24240 [Burkholderia thailandensis]|nr:hypothetical protein [Burkholderia thailandensis]MBS2127585.1 hypothetical protein [Burkholderia thailandensis]MCS3397766.1 hypothetical protein [Burkholderia thailandensis]MCS6473430.1 hypothetical protein [Burkholderia thailandensis]MCS6479884.1 hypothetical protein [Burkholderia thailandensis]MCS6497682.1 hypothetical protein [Burkholderia thailandensis]
MAIGLDSAAHVYGGVGPRQRDRLKRFPHEVRVDAGGEQCGDDGMGVGREGVCPPLRVIRGHRFRTAYVDKRRGALLEGRRAGCADLEAGIPLLAQHRGIAAALRRLRDVRFVPLQRPPA